jgi:DnaJ-domain-containing protein 1
MAGQFRAERFSCSTSQESCQGIPAFEPDESVRNWQLVDDFQPIVGDDAEPDPLFFVECWTFGTSTAATNFQQRRQKQADYERSSHAFRDLSSSRVLSFAQQCDMEAKALSAAGDAASAGRYYADWSRQNSEEPAERTQNQNPQPSEKSAESYESCQETIQSMTLQCACRLLGVNATSTREQIKTAYRQMASQWHPDRLECRTKQDLRIATEQMAAINEAYHLLRSCLRQESACSCPN